MDRENGQRGWLPVARGVGERGDIYGPAAQRRGIGRTSDGRGVGADGCGSAAVHGEAGEVGDGEWLVEAWTYALPQLEADLGLKVHSPKPSNQ
jgi:hypothetical protein